MLVNCQPINVRHQGLNGLVHLSVSISGFSHMAEYLVEALGQTAEFVFCFDLQRLGLDLSGLREIAVR